MTSGFPSRIETTEPAMIAPDLARRAADSFPVDDLVNLVVTTCANTVFPGQSQDVEFLGHLRASVAENAHALREIIAGRLQPDDVVLDKVLYLPTLQAQLHIPQKSLQRSYRLAFFLQWERWTEHFQEAVARADLSADDTAHLLTWLTRVVLSYQDHVASLVAEIYTRDYEVLSRSRAQVRRTLVRNVLRGEEGTISASDMTMIGYPLGAHHVAVLLPEMSEGAASQLSERLRMAAAAHQTLVYPLTLGSTVVWLARFESWPRSAVDAVLDVLTRVGAVACVSGSAAGLYGFRRSLAQAQEAQRVRDAWGPIQAPPVLTHFDAGLEILLLQDDALARSFVETELGPLSHRTTEAARLRETLEASFRFGSHVGAAQALQLHEHTVRNRLHRAEELLGRPLQERRTEVQVALRLVRLMDNVPHEDS
jgi:sugar diacid utilization regulator